MRLEELPGEIRLELSDRSERELWDRIGTVRSFCSDTAFTPSELYNWKNHSDHIPVELVRAVGLEPEVRSLKGGGRSLPMEDPVFPMPESDELLTRVRCSVHVNSEGVPVYQTGERSLIRRFRQLLRELGDVPCSVYSREVHELRYPKYVHSILSEMSGGGDLAALADEEGRIEDGKIVAGGKEIAPGEVKGDLYSRDMQIEVAVLTEDSEKVLEMMGEEARKVEKIAGEG
ncbi:MAG: hypothetical protein ABEK01_04680 [Candidatus Nanohaloarchaea archaeon]